MDKARIATNSRRRGFIPILPLILLASIAISTFIVVAQVQRRQELRGRAVEGPYAPTPTPIPVANPTSRPTAVPTRTPYQQCLDEGSTPSECAAYNRLPGGSGCANDSECQTGNCFKPRDEPRGEGRGRPTPVPTRAPTPTPRPAVDPRSW